MNRVNEGWSDAQQDVKARFQMIDGVSWCVEICIANPTSAKLRGIQLRSIAPEYVGSPQHDMSRRPGESPDDFYRRISQAYRDGGRSVKVLALRAGVPNGTAAAWVSRARARGFEA